MAGRKIRDESDARMCLVAVESSGLTRTRWASEQGVDARSLNAWRLNLERREARTESGPERGSLRLVELVPFERHARYRVCCGPFAVELDGNFDPEQVTRLLCAVAAAC